MKETRTRLKQNQRGLVSILVTMLIMLFLSIIVLGFAKFIQREQRQALDRQLNTQAFYAAETGINDAKNAIKTKLGAGSVPSKPGCGNDANYTLNPVVNASTGVGYTCVLINPAPATLEYSTIDTSNSTVIPLVLTDTTDSIKDITLQWQAQNGSSDFTCPDSGAGTPNFPDLPPAGGWTCGTGILRVDLVPFGSSATRNDLDDSLFNAFLYPQASGGVASTTYNGAGTQLKANNFKVTCSTANTPKFCKFTISNIKALVGGTYGNTYRAYLRVKSVYIASSLTISATTNSGNPASFSGTQVMIDSTGKANDVLRRIQVRVPVNLSGILPDSPLDTSGSICKRYLVGASSVSDPDGCGF